MASPMVVHGLKETQVRLTQALKDLDGPKAVKAMRDATLIVQREAKKAAPVFSGELRASLIPEVKTDSRHVTGIVGSKVKHALFMEKGTKPHFPPVIALQAWARRHGVNAFVVARAISRKGLKPRRFLESAFDDNRDRIIKKLGEGVERIVRDAS